MNPKELLQLGKQKLEQLNIEDAYYKAKILLKYVLKQTDKTLIASSLDEVSLRERKEYEEKLKEIVQGKPVQYITNSQEFMGLHFYVDENVLIPQPDTEVLVETAIKLIKENNSKENTTRLENREEINSSFKEKTKILDLCTGSGCIGIAIAKYTENTQVTLSDISEQALEIVKKNAKQNEVELKIQVIHSDLFEEIEKESFDYIVSNPPYIETNTMSKLPKEVQNEPHLALDGGKDGLKFYSAILKQGAKYLKQEGYLLLEIGYNQFEKIINLWKNDNCNLKLITKDAIKDFGGNDRVLIFQKDK